MSTKTRWWWKWHGSVEHEHGQTTYFCGTVNEVPDDLTQAVTIPNYPRPEVKAFGERVNAVLAAKEKL